MNSFNGFLSTMHYKAATIVLVTFLSECWCTSLISPDVTKILKTSDFIKIRQSPFFVDKTLFMLKIFTNEEPLVFTAPPGFGKSTIIDMVRVFLSNSIDFKVAQDLFLDTNIAKDSNFVKTHLGNHPVVHCSLEPTSPVSDFNTMVANYQKSLHKTFLQHPYLAGSKKLKKGDINQYTKFVCSDNHTSLEPSEISSGLYFLSKVLKTHHDKPVILLIDDFDSIIWEGVITQSLGLREVLEFFSNVLKQVINDRENIKKIILTGTSSILLKLLPGLENMKCVRFLHNTNFVPFFGLTGDEVDHLVDQSVYVSLRPNLTEWYDGYTDPDLSAHIYNTKSLLSFLLLSQGKLNFYWENKKAQKLLKILLEDSVRKGLLLDSPEKIMVVVRELKEINVGVLEAVKTMINQEIWDASVSDLLIHLLTEQGYFTYDKPWERSGYNSSVTLRIANLDVCESIKKYIIGYIEEMKRLSSNLNIV